MRVLTCVVFALTIVAGWCSYSRTDSAAEFLKLAYAYLALMSVVCAMIVLTMKPAPSSRPLPDGANSSTIPNES